MADPYVTLGVARGADDATIKKAYRRLAKQYHPDRNKDDAAAAGKFGEITGAYDLLSNEEKRASFDRGEIDEHGNPRQQFGSSEAPFGREYRGGGNEFTFDDDVDLSSVLDGIFGRNGIPRGGRRSAPRGADAAYRLTVSFEDAANAKQQKVVLPNGRHVEVPLPSGAETGTRVLLRGEGDQGPGGAGDAYFTVEVAPHPLFTREGDDVHAEIPIRIDEAVLGAKIRVPTVDGRLMLTVPKASTSGRQLRIRGKGFRRADGSRGNQIVKLMVDIPAEDEELAEFANRWKGRSYDPRARIV